MGAEDKQPGASAVTRVYDAENRLASETQANNYLAGSYTYDAEGQRVRRKVDGVETWQVYGLGGELLAEYAANASYSAPQKEYGYRNGQLLITAGPAAAGQQVNVALATNGATASASSTYGSQAPSRAINGDRSGAGYNCWTDNTSYGYNDSLEVAFA
ncbi:MAG TPA: hypothetical protein VGN90_14655, partial [Pyrinomonadaceae bacterium]|nr:hypothetical protein [Pyrinomonadaceae bacterium]